MPPFSIEEKVKLKLLALGVLIATSAGVAHAEGKFSLGAGVGVVEHPYKDYDTDGRRPSELALDERRRLDERERRIGESWCVRSGSPLPRR